MDHKNIWVFVERKDSHIHPVSFELLNKARELNRELGEEVVALNIGEVSPQEREEISQYGAQEIIEIGACVEGKEGYGVWAELIYRSILKEKPSIFLAGATNLGRTLMPLVAVKAQTGLTADCTELTIDKDRRILLQTRPAFGGNILATIECPLKKPQMATVRPHVFKMKKEGGALARVLKKRYDYSPDNRTKVIRTIVEEEKLNISEADVIVAGGRGLGKAEGFELLTELAGRLNGVVGASRGATDLGWMDSSHQVGQTGHTVSPSLYVACGISGAVQHLIGMKGSKTIIAINEDPDAPIFEVADYGIVGDLYEVIPQILREMDKSGQ